MAQDEPSNKIEEGRALYENLIKKFHGGKIDKMYGFFESNVEFIHFYGDDKETRIINYCAFKRDTVLGFYNRYLDRKRAKEEAKNVVKKEHESKGA